MMEEEGVEVRDAGRERLEEVGEEKGEGVDEGEDALGVNAVEWKLLERRDEAKGVGSVSSFVEPDGASSDRDEGVQCAGRL
jgi:hypothetical protein